MAKFKGPAHCTGISIGGQSFATEDGNTIIVPDEDAPGYASILKSHGFDLVPEDGEDGTTAGADANAPAAAKPAAAKKPSAPKKPKAKSTAPAPAPVSEPEPGADANAPAAG